VTSFIGEELKREFVNDHSAGTIWWLMADWLGGAAIRWRP
jgi:hypothetical protein